MHAEGPGRCRLWVVGLTHTRTRAPPCTDTVVLGGTLGRGDYDTTPRPQDRDRILRRACAVLPSLAAAELVAEWVRRRLGSAGRGSHRCACPPP